MTTYERVEDGRVVEAVTPIDGSHEDTRLGVMVLEGEGTWRIQGAPEPEGPAPSDDSAPPEATGEPADDNTGEPNDRPADPAPEHADAKSTPDPKPTARTRGGSAKEKD